MSDEIWMPVLGYEGIYDVSNLGRVRSWVAKTPGLILAQDRRPGDYCRVQFKYRQKHCSKLVHVLVDEAFNGPRIKGLFVNHKDGNKHNNNLLNLERITHRENVRHAVAMGLFGTRRGVANKFAVLTDEQVAEIKRVYATQMKNGRIRHGVASELAKKFGVAGNTISGIGRGKSWTHVLPSGVEVDA